MNAPMIVFLLACYAICSGVAAAALDVTVSEWDTSRDADFAIILGGSVLWPLTLTGVVLVVLWHLTRALRFLPRGFVRFGRGVRELYRLWVPKKEPEVVLPKATARRKEAQDA